jgi:hypothetical protein
LLAACGLAACDARVHDQQTRSTLDSTRMSSPTIAEVLDAHTPALMAISGVQGTGIGEQDGKPCIIVFVRKRDARLKREIPARLDGYAVRIDEVGEVRPVK